MIDYTVFSTEMAKDVFLINALPPILKNRQSRKTASAIGIEQQHLHFKNVRAKNITRDGQLISMLIWVSMSFYGK